MTYEYQVLLAQPRTVAVTMTAPSRRVLSVDEPAMPEDPTSSHPELEGGYVAYSASGTAAGQIVYVNYGLPADYAELATLGVSLKGRIALARYGRSHRAVKTHTAEQAGARALILYSDPGDDGETKGPAWPNGYWRGPQMVQRGNAKYCVVLARRSAHAGRGRHQGRRAHSRSHGADLAEDPGRGAERE